MGNLRYEVSNMFSRVFESDEYANYWAEIVEENKEEVSLKKIRLTKELLDKVYCSNCTPRFGDYVLDGDADIETVESLLERIEEENLYYSELKESIKKDGLLNKDFLVFTDLLYFTTFTEYEDLLRDYDFVLANGISRFLAIKELMDEGVDVDLSDVYLVVVDDMITKPHDGYSVDGFFHAAKLEGVDKKFIERAQIMILQMSLYFDNCVYMLNDGSRYNELRYKAERDEEFVDWALEYFFSDWEIADTWREMWSKDACSTVVDIVRSFISYAVKWEITKDTVMVFSDDFDKDNMEEAEKAYGNSFKSVKINELFLMRNANTSWMKYILSGEEIGDFKVEEDRISAEATDGDDGSYLLWKKKRMDERILEVVAAEEGIKKTLKYIQENKDDFIEEVFSPEEAVEFVERLAKIKGIKK